MVLTFLVPIHSSGEDGCVNRRFRLLIGLIDENVYYRGRPIQVGPYEVRLEKREVIVVEGSLWGVDEAAFVDELLLPMSGWVSPFSHVA